MNLETAFTEINWLSVILATIAAFAIGGRNEKSEHATHFRTFVRSEFYFGHYS